MSEHPDFAVLLADLVSRHGGVAMFSPVQREIAGHVVSLMIDMRSSLPGDLVKHADALNRLVNQLPPIVPPPPKETVRTFGPGTTLTDLVNAYCNMIRDERCEAWEFEDGCEPPRPTSPSPCGRPAASAAGGTDVPAAERPGYAAQPPPSPEPSYEADEPVVRPADHNAGSVTVYRQPSPPARRDVGMDRRYGDVHRGERHGDIHRGDRVMPW